ncbi:glycosyltransferase 87 family protein [Herbiconiux liangxiaofengii]|uniref:glycosyltransferase 87 family protein n=1 Tax=Herbiconiux liangxiaofengii TaxID=3342795 RepID=UPI0035B9C0ED
MLIRLRRLAASPLVLWAAFVALHVWLGYVGLTHPNQPFGDVTNVYKGWVEQFQEGYRLGIDGPWVYPIVAIVPMLAAGVLGPDNYGIGWMLVVTVADASIFAYLTARTRRAGRPLETGELLRLAAAWWWLIFLFLLGSVALGRIDIITVDLVIAGLLVVRDRPALAGVLLALATWVKVWPAAMIAAVVISVRRRMRVAVAAAVTLVAVLAAALALGAGGNAFSFVSEQTGRGMQIEAPVSVVWLWSAFFGGGSQVYYDQQILTFQVTGPGSDAAALLMTPLLVVAVAAVLVLALLVVRSGTPATHVLPALALALVMALIVFNKVGSPQFMVWLSAPVILGIVTQGRRFFWPAVLAFVMAGLTQIIYPIAYDSILGLDPVMLTVLSLRNLLSVVMLVIAVVMLWQSRKRSTEMGHHAGGVFRGTVGRGLARG